MSRILVLSVVLSILAGCSASANLRYTQELGPGQKVEAFVELKR